MVAAPTVESCMDLWKLLTQGWPVITAAPFIVLGLMAAAAGVTWWFRGSLDKATISGLVAQVGALKERLQLAADREHAAIEAREVVGAQVADLQALIERNAPMQAIASRSSSAVTSLQSLIQAQNDVSATFDPVCVYAVSPVPTSKKA
jgi:hypothetical protein